MPDPRYAHCPACAGGRPDCPRCDGEGIVEEERARIGSSAWKAARGRVLARAEECPLCRREPT